MDATHADGASLHGRTAIVTGGNTGIGKAVVLALAGNGANVVIDYVADKTAEDALEQSMRELGEQSLGVEADVSKVEDLRKLVDAAVSRFGRVDIMVNNAGIETRSSILDTTEEQYQRVLDINLKSAFFGTQLAAAQMIAQGDGGRIINMTSVHEDWPMPGNTPYCLSKGGMRMLTRTAGIELAPHGITVVGVGPGAVDTPINKSTVSDPALLSKLDAAIPLGRMAEPQDIASVVTFLAGGGASYVTATTVFVDGGLMHASLGL
ncbi:MAG: SDR family NAD(P)-dependent oxidoreductase [Acidimicrobiales bacterium]